MKGLIFYPLSSDLPLTSLYKVKITSKGFIFLKIRENEKVENLDPVWDYFEKETNGEITPSFLSSFIKELGQLFPIEEVLVGLIIEKKMYLARQGDIVCFLKRGGKFGPILIEGNVSYGVVKKIDKIFISSTEKNNRKRKKK